MNPHNDIFAKHKLEAKAAEEKQRALQIAYQDAKRHYVNPARHEEAVRRFMSLKNPAPLQKPARKANSDPPGDEVEYYVWNEGEMGTITLVVTTPFIPLPAP